MATTPTSTPPPKTNRIGLDVTDYRGGKTTLCDGCGQNAISERIIDAMYEMGVKPERVAKLSGNGCSSKSPVYFMGRFFFSSRRRHTRFDCDWSSDVCSSD